MGEEDDERSRTIFCGNLHDDVTEDLLYELFLQGGPIDRVNIPKTNDGRPRNFGFVVYSHAISVPYALNIFRDTSLFYKKLNIRLSSHGKVAQPQSNNSTNFDSSNSSDNNSLRQGFNNFSGMQSMPNIPIMFNNQQQQTLPPNMFNPSLLFGLGNNIFSDIQQQQFLAATAMQMAQNSSNPINKPYPSQRDNDRDDNFKMSNRDKYRNHHKNAYPNQDRGSQGRDRNRDNDKDYSRDRDRKRRHR